MDKLPVDRPKYLLDTDRWEIRTFDDCWNNGNDHLQKFGYGALSYAWGKWKDRSAYAINKPGYPTFAIGNGQNGAKLSWGFPIVKNELDNSKEQFTIDAVRTTLKLMGLRFVWWDWACIPQYLGPNSGDGDPILRSDKEAEVNKMRFVYPHSKRGTIWMHSVAWNGASAMEKAIRESCKYLEMKGGSKTLDNVDKVVKALGDVNAAEIWFQSLWCFQEGVLFSNPVRRNSIFADSAGKALELESYHNTGDLLDLVTAASGIGSTIINLLRYRAEAPGQPPFRNPNEPPSVPPTFQDWCWEPANEQGARQRMDQLIGTGLVFFATQNPLSLLNARFSRKRSPWTTDIDLEVNTVIGALEVNIQEYQDEANRILPIPSNASEDEKKVLEPQRVQLVREGMLAELFKVYQWRMLLFATASRQVTGNMHGIWSELVRVRNQQKSPMFTSLEYFISTKNLSERFKPAKTAYVGDPPVQPTPAPIMKGQFALPNLEYQRNNGVLLLKRLSNYKVFQLNKVTKPLWTKCMFYEYAPQGNDGTFIPKFKLVKWEDWAQVFSKDAVLVPVERSFKSESGNPWEKKNRLRLVVLGNFGDASQLGYPKNIKTKRAGTFVGVVDVEGATDEGLKMEDGNMDLAEEDVTVY